MTITAVAPGPGRSAWAEELIRVQAIATGATCEQLSGPALQALFESVERAASLPSRPGWEVKATAYAQTFRLLADAADGRPAMARVLSGATRLTRDLMITVGPAANGMIISSRRRLLAHLRAGDAPGAALEMENHLRVLHYMWRLASPSRPPE